MDCGVHWHPNPDEKGMDLSLELSDTELSLIQSAGYAYEILIHDLERYYADRSRKDMPLALHDLEQRKAQSLGLTRNAGQDLGCLEDAFPTPQNFQLGSMGGFPTYQEILDQLDSMSVLYPNLITSKNPISDSLLTIEGRSVFYVKISDKPTTDENEPEVLYTGMHHAREPGSAMNLMYYMWYLLENYATDQEVKNLVDHRELFFIPIVNPDGYLFNEVNNPAGGGLWRKNMRQNIDGTVGVDLNRNYGYNWGLDNAGSSPSTSSPTYRGTAPFSEPETRMMKEFVEDRSFLTAFNNHSFGNLILSPWAYTDSVNPENHIFNAWGNHMTWFNRYEFGQGNGVLYAVNGGATDWFYGEQSTKSKVYPFVPEIGSPQEGAFWPSPTNILPQCERQMRMSLLLAYVAGRYGLVHDLSPMSLESLQGESRLFH